MEFSACNRTDDRTHANAGLAFDRINQTVGHLKLKIPWVQERVVCGEVVGIIGCYATGFDYQKLRRDASLMGDKMSNKGTAIWTDGTELVHFLGNDPIL